MALTKHFIVFCTNLKFEFIFINFMKWFFLFICLLNKWLLVLNYKLQCTLTMYTYTYINCNSKKVCTLCNSKKQYVKFGRPFLWAALMLGANGPSAQIRAAQIRADKVVYSLIKMLTYIIVFVTRPHSWPCRPFSVSSYVCWQVYCLFQIGVKITYFVITWKQINRPQYRTG